MTASPCAMHRPRRLPGRGFSLIEVLVSMFIVSLGILALAGLMQSATRYGKMSEVRSTATLLANDIADHLRANVVGGTGSFYDVTQAFPATAPIERRKIVGDQCTDKTSPCSPDEVAAVDLFNWSQRLLLTLPQGTPFIRYNAPGLGQSPTVDIWVAWQDPATSATGQTDRPDGECPPGLDVAGTPSVRCVYLQVGLGV